MKILKIYFYDVITNKLNGFYLILYVLRPSPGNVLHLSTCVSLPMCFVIILCSMHERNAQTDL